MRRFITTALTATLLAAPMAQTANKPVRIPTKPCLHEDSINCFWDAGRRGNGKGYSFWVDTKGKVHYLDPRKGR